MCHSHRSPRALEIHIERTHLKPLPRNNGRAAARVAAAATGSGSPQPGPARPAAHPTFPPVLPRAGQRMRRSGLLATEKQRRGPPLRDRPRAANRARPRRVSEACSRPGPPGRPGGSGREEGGGGSGALGGAPVVDSSSGAWGGKAGEGGRYRRGGKLRRCQLQVSGNNPFCVLASHPSRSSRYEREEGWRWRRGVRREVAVTSPLPASPVHRPVPRLLTGCVSDPSSACLWAFGSQEPKLKENRYLLLV